MNIQIRSDWVGYGLEIIFWEERDGKVYAVQPMEMIFKECPGGATTGPSLRIAGAYANEFMKAFAEALDKKGVKTENDHKIAGTLEATRFHLEDMRKLLKLK